MPSRVVLILVVAGLVLTGCSPTEGLAASDFPSQSLAPGPSASRITSTDPRAENEALRQEILSWLSRMEDDAALSCVAMKAIRDGDSPISLLDDLESGLMQVSQSATELQSLGEPPQGWLAASNRTKEAADTALAMTLYAGLAIGALRTQSVDDALSLLPDAIAECDALRDKVKAAREAIDAAP